MELAQCAAQLRRERERDPERFQVRGGALLLAETERELGHVSAALDQYAAAAGLPALRPTALERAAELLIANAEDDRARERLGELMVVVRRGHGRWRAARYARAAAAQRLGLAEAAAEFGAIADDADDPRRAEARLRQAQALYSRGSDRSGSEKLLALLRDQPSSDAALAALALLEQREAEGLGPPPVSAQEFLERTAVLEQNRVFGRAVAYLEAAIALRPSQQAELSLRIGRALYRAGDYPGAHQALEAARRGASRATAAAAEVMLAVVALRADDFRAAREHLMVALDREPGGASGLEARQLLMEVAAYSGDEAAVVEQAALLRAGFRSNPEAVRRAWLAEGRAQLRAGRAEAAREPFARLVALASDPADRLEALYWSAVAAQEAGATAAALALYDQAVQAEPRSLYADLARSRWRRLDEGGYRHSALRLLAEASGAAASGNAAAARGRLVAYLDRFPDGEDAGGAIAQLRREYFRSAPHRELLDLSVLAAEPPASSSGPYAEFVALRYLGLDGAAARALWDRLDRDSEPRAWLSLAAAALAGDEPHLAWRAAQRVRRKAPRDWVPELLPAPIPSALWPLPYRGQLERAAAASAVDPLLIAAIIHQESRYDPRAKSPAAARGLMQLIPSTAAAVAGAIGLELTGPDDLYVPENSIRLGCSHFKSLLEIFGGDVFRAVAAYNTGAARVQLWSRKCRSAEPDELIAEIYLSQPKRYLSEVMATWAAYRRLYGPKPELVRRALAAADRPGLPER